MKNLTAVLRHSQYWVASPLFDKIPTCPPKNAYGNCVTQLPRNKISISCGLCFNNSNSRWRSMVLTCRIGRSSLAILLEYLIHAIKRPVRASVLALLFRLERLDHSSESLLRLFE